MTSKYRHYSNVVRLVNNQPTKPGQRVDGTMSQIRGHSIMFQTDATAVTTAALFHTLTYDDSAWKRPANDLQKALTFELIGPDGGMDILLKNAAKSPFMKCRPHALYQRLCVYQHCHKHFMNDVKLPTGDDVDFPRAFAMFAKNISKLNQSLESSIIKVTDSTAIDSDKYETDDVASVRTSVSTHTDVCHPPNQQQQQECNFELSYTLVTKPPELSIDRDTQKDEQNRRSYLLELLDAFGIALPDKDCPWKVSRETEPGNEFECMDKLLVMTFPHIFLLGKTYDTTSLPNKSQIRHLLCQFTCAAAVDRELIFYLFDAQSRHSILKGISKKIKNDPDAFRKWCELVDSDSFRDKLRRAVLSEKTTTNVCKEVFHTILPILSIGTQFLTSDVAHLILFSCCFSNGILPLDISNDILPFEISTFFL